ncbi:hypothetical protein K505DRAFT_324612 [Melanomma pulvis-pyrius CBS 109.77]|uniref:Uncharacterized protein n=1 Tax=Melanomma pulvis-pyrius CBS 109.77 TaxID=1314802 RepID=A0A6A6XE20_9PLEO|nr:hypothetical protein K505DRAFT_324612 [Melanomma pulvis-pyrius CBS 109.77]
MYDPGFFFSIIDQLQAVPSFPPDSAVEAPSEPLWLILAKTLTCGIGDCSGAEYTLARYPNLESLGHLGQGSVAWLTAIWDCFSAHCFDPAGEVFQHVLLKALGAKSRPFSTDANIASTFLNYVANILVSDRLFVTTEGYIGLAPRCIRGGDFVAIFNGCDTPYVVRRAGKIKHEDEMFDEALHVVGPCYLHGIMNGEIFADRDAPRFKRLKWMRHDGDVADSLEGCMMLV